MIRFNDIQQSGIDLSPLGWEMGDSRSDYFCTPVGAKVFGWAGVDGIHYCTLRGLGSTVFAVSPMNCPGEYVHPIAGNLEILLSLLLACGNMDAIEQCWQWDRAQFDQFLQENPVTDKQRISLDAIRERFGIEPADDPWGYIHDLQADFDLKLIRFRPEYYADFPDTPRPEWKVTYSKGRASEEIPIGKSFHWAGYQWQAMSMYTCAEGLLVDFCIRADRDAVQAFLDKWVPILRGNPAGYNHNFQQIQQESPLNLPYCHEFMTLNGKRLQWDSSTSHNWIPEDMIPEERGGDLDGVEWITHYDLDYEEPWIFHRSKFRWATLRKPVIKSVQLRLEPQPESIFGERFPCPAVGEAVEITHPRTGQVHALTVTNLCPGQLEPSRHLNPRFAAMPTHYLSMEYTLSPDLPQQALRIQDTVQSDSPQLKPDPEDSAGAASIGIIGGADGPTSIFIAQPHSPASHSASSSLHYEPVENVTWVPVFREKLLEDITVQIL